MATVFNKCTSYKGLTLNKHQLSLTKYIMENDVRRMLIYHSLGSGKTITGITILNCLRMKYTNKTILIISPASVIQNFEKEIKKLDVENAVIMTHQKFTNMVKTKLDEVKSYFKNVILLVDEAQNFKNLKSKSETSRSKLLQHATKFCFGVFLLSATPVQNRPNEITNLLNIVNNLEFDKTISTILKKGLSDDYSELVPYVTNKISYFQFKSDMFPEVIYKRLEFIMNRKYYKAYHDIETKKGGHGFCNDKNLTCFYNGIRRAINNLEKIPNQKVDYIEKNINKFSGKKLIFSNWLDSGLIILQTKLLNMGIKNKLIIGATSAELRKQYVEDYNNDKIEVLLISTAGAEGLDLKGVRHIFLLEPSWNNEKVKQIVGRGVRFKSHNDLPINERNVTVYTLIYKKPKKKLMGDTEEKSADVILYNMSKSKEDEVDIFYDFLIHHSIERVGKKVCPDDKILNPKTGRCIKKTG